MRRLPAQAPHSSLMTMVDFLFARFGQRMLPVEGLFRDLRVAHAQALARTLQMSLMLAGPQHDVDLLRKESLTNLAPAAARRVLAHSYASIFPITTLPFPPLPVLQEVNGAPPNVQSAASVWLVCASERCENCACCLFLARPGHISDNQVR